MNDRPDRSDPDRGPAAAVDMPNGGTVGTVAARRTRQLTVAFVVLVICTNVGSIMAPTIVKRSPELLLALSSRIRHLLLSVPAGISPIGYSLIGFARLMLAGLLLFALGRIAGERVFRWFDVQSGGERPAMLRWIESGVRRADWLLILLFPGSNIVAFLVGRRGMAWRRYVPLLAIGVIGRLTWVWFTAKQFEDELKSALDFIDRYQWRIVLVLLLATFIPSMRKAYRQDKAARAADEPTEP
jgi:hypothetical protein